MVISNLKPLKTEWRKKYTEYLAYIVLRTCFPVEFEGLVWGDAPDLLLPSESLGIEVTIPEFPERKQIEGEFIKLMNGKSSEEEKRKCKEKIEALGGKVIDRAVLWPSIKQEDEQRAFRLIIQKKLSKIDSYRRRGFEKMGIFILCSESLIPPYNIEKDWLECFDNAQEGYFDRFDVLYFCYPSALLFYDFNRKEYSITRIEPILFDEMKREARNHMDEMIAGE